jgi:hypothetical protein
LRTSDVICFARQRARTVFVVGIHIEEYQVTAVLRLVQELDATQEGRLVVMELGQLAGRRRVYPVVL